MLRFGVLSSAAVVTLWALLAWINPETTYHLAPVIAVAASPVVSRMLAEKPLTARVAALTVGVGLALTIASAIVISAVGWMRGPSISPAISPLAELVVVIAVGAVRARS